MFFLLSREKRKVNHFIAAKQNGDIMKYSKIIAIALLAAMFLAACSSAKAPVKYSMAQSISTGCSTPNIGETGVCQIKITPGSTTAPTPGIDQQAGLTKSDAQGAVTVEVTPLNLDQPADTLLFDISMNTHSVDLSMDLAQLSTLTTDTGKTIQASLWDAPKGGHHLEGKLSFPAAQKGKKLLAGARSITLTINNVDVQSRVFTWQISK